MMRVLGGHVLEKLALLPAESVHCVVTSPPYFGLRSYGTAPQVWGGEEGCEHEWGDEQEARRSPFGANFVSAVSGRPVGKAKREGGTVSQGAFCLHCNAWRGELGLEPSLGLYLDHMVEICREIRRVLRKDGTFWLNISDSFAGSWGAQSRRDEVKGVSSTQIASHPKRASRTGSIRAPGLKPKDLMLIPSRLSIRLQDDGWWVRQINYWCKKAPMPESCTDRTTSAVEWVIHLTKSRKYFYDAQAVAELSGGDESERQQTRNLRNFWFLGPSPFAEAHFATFPSEVPRIAITAGTSEKGVCPKCGAPWERVTKSTFVKLAQRRDTRKAVQPGADMADMNSLNEMGYNETETIGWQPTCSHEGDPVPATVLDPFLGAGTTALVADQLQRDCIGIELSPGYAAMAERRVRGDAGIFAVIEAEREASAGVVLLERALVRSAGDPGLEMNYRSRKRLAERYQAELVSLAIGHPGDEPDDSYYDERDLDDVSACSQCGRYPCECDDC